MSSITKKLFVISLFSGFFLLSWQANGQIPEEIIQSLKTGNAKVLSTYFNQNVELVVPDSDNVYSKAQAQLIVNEFFSNYPPQTFVVKHHGGKEDSQYVIGNLVTKNNAFRVYFLLKKDDGKDFIHQLRIEKQE